MIGRRPDIGLWAAAAALAFWGADTLFAQAQQAAANPTVMSLNVCTDQLAMLLAAPGQLVSVSNLAADPALSFLHEQAAQYPANRGLAEEVFLARPDIVVTGTYSLHNTSALLRRFDYRVEEFAFAQTLESIPGDIRRMGAILRQEARAEAMARDFEVEVAASRAATCEPKPVALAWDQNGIALGEGTLADSVMEAAGFTNLATETGYSGMTPFPLELIVTHRPDVVIVRDAMSEAPALADQLAGHPALGALSGTRVGSVVPAGSWSCGGPFVIEAIRALRRLRDEIGSCQPPEPRS